MTLIAIRTTYRCLFANPNRRIFLHYSTCNFRTHRKTPITKLLYQIGLFPRSVRATETRFDAGLFLSNTAPSLCNDCHWIIACRVKSKCAAVLSINIHLIHYVVTLLFLYITIHFFIKHINDLIYSSLLVTFLSSLIEI
ncbi:Uncharacterised protein [Photobacterium damselae]|uniref:Uncharacterized protein n=1 Tax=Photobacterium damselae TaxID=38293 RepID=A0A2X1YFM8_PHODM|nr:Uncharacterised protein [Photobacterium damselae]